MTTVLLIRHGSTDIMDRGVGGRSEGISLNTAGRAEARELVVRLAGIPLHSIYSSPQQRARETAL